MGGFVVCMFGVGIAIGWFVCLGELLGFFFAISFVLWVLDTLLVGLVWFVVGLVQLLVFWFMV